MLYSSIFLLLSINFCVCKWNLRKVGRRIKGGEYAKPHQEAHTAFIRMSCGPNYWICSSSVVNQFIVMTAGHCLTGCHRRVAIEIYAGHSNINAVTIRRESSTYLIHERYSEISSYGDIALISVIRPLPLGSKIKRVIIRRTFPSDSQGLVSGWGVMNRITLQSSVNLKTVKVKIFDSKSCGVGTKMKSGLMCATSGNPEHHPDKGDSGGPFMTKDFQQIGLVSHSSLSSPHMVVFTNVSKFYDWIEITSISLHCLKKRNK